MAEQLVSITELPVADIEGWEDESRLRRVTQAGCAPILASIEELGVMLDEIHVRKVKHQGNRFLLMVGGHRLAVAKMLGWETIPAKVWLCSDDEAKLFELDDNLASRDLNALDTAVFLAERKRLYEKMHPETVKGLAGAAGRWHGTDIASFAVVTAEKFNMTPRNVRRIVAAAEGLTREDVLALSKAQQQVSLADLQALSKVSEEKHRKKVVAALVGGEVKNAKAAIDALSPKRAKVKDPVNDGLNALKLAWKNAPKKARRQFVAQTPELVDLLSEAEA